MSTIAVLAVSARRSVTKLSFKRLPKKSIPKRDNEPGTIRAQTRSPKIGKRIFSRLETVLGGFILIKRSFLVRSEEHTSELQSRPHLVCRLLLEKKKKKYTIRNAQ